MQRFSVCRISNLGLWLGTVVLSACAGSTPLPPVTNPPSAPRNLSEDRAGSKAVSATPPPAAQDSGGPEEADDPATLEPVVARGERVPFTRAQVQEKDCWQLVPLTGEAVQDYASLIEHCGKPTGAIEYARPAIGTLDFARDKRDTVIVFLRGGLCYRFFGVGDASIPSLEIVIERNGALQGEDRASGSVAIINTDRAWCIDSDAEYRFLVKVGRQGHGRYVFGVWARPPT